MRKRILNIMLCCVMLVGGVMPTTAFATDGSTPAGTGTAEDPYLISTVEELKTFRDMVNSTGSICAKLTTDITLNDEQWTPIANYTGTFDGNRKTISGLNVTGVAEAGLFASLSGNAVVNNLTVEGNIEASNTNNNAYAGGIAAQISGSAQISGCVNNAAVKATVTNNVDAAYAAYTGGMAGHASGSVKITGCKNIGTVQTNSASASTNTGGMAGYAGGGAAIENCLNTAYLSAASDHSDPDRQYDNYASASRSGGIVGSATNVTITGCYNTGTITVTGTGDYVDTGRAGGIVGYLQLFSTSSATISNCGNAGPVTATQTFSSARAGGIAGNVSVDKSMATITCCYNTGTITGTYISSNAVNRNCAGSIAGVLENLNEASTQFSQCYWLTGSASGSVGWNPQNVELNGIEARSRGDFADGTVLALLQDGDTNNLWTQTGYLPAAGMTLPLLSWQTADTHDHDFKLLKYDETNHWKECACGVVDASSKTTHTGGTATCTDKATCTACGGKYGNLNPAYHTGTEGWTKTATTHEKKWSCCNVVTVPNESHEWENGICSECHYNCAHTGGTATCTDKATCSTCGEKYGAVDPNNHTGTKQWIQTATEHEQKWNCCGTEAVAEEPHEWKNGVCEKCGYIKPYRPTVQKPEINVIGSGKVILSTDGRTADIAADEGYELVSITLNGKEVANTDKLTGLKTGDKVVVTFQKKSEEPTVDTKAIADKVGKMQMTARSSKTAKKNIRITVNTDRETNNLIKELKDLGYTVKYKYYRSTKKASKYIAKVEKDADINSYINTSGKKGTRYYYKVRVMVYDADGNLVAKSDLKQCSYAARIWSK